MTKKKRGSSKSTESRPKVTKKRKRHIKLMVIPEPEPDTRSVFMYVGDGTVAMKGPGNVVMECGKCGAPLVEGVPVSQIRNIVFFCQSCGAHNETIVV
jgi:hypothetical protein